MNFPEEHIKKYDRNDLLGDINSMGKLLLHGYNSSKNISLSGKFSNIVLAGMGGSSSAGFIFKSYIREFSEIPMICSREYNLPKEANKNSLIICISYSGNTEETVSSYREAMRKGYTVITMCSGGKLEELAQMNNHPNIKLKENMQPRSSVSCQIGALLGIMKQLGVVSGLDAQLEKARKALSQDIFTHHAISISEKIFKKIPVIYASGLLYPIAYRWKVYLNENSKILALCSALPELAHNEIEGIAHASQQGNFHFILISSIDDTEKLKKRIQVTKQLLKNKNIEVTELNIKGKTRLIRFLSALKLGNLVSYYLALRYETNPSKTPYVDLFKEKVK